MFGVFVGRALFARWLRRAASSGRFQRRVAVVGVGEQARYLLTRLQEDPAPWRRVVAIFDDRTMARTGAEIDGYPIVGNLGDLVDWVRSGHIDDIVVTFPWNADRRLIKVIQRLRELPVHIYVGCDLIGYHFPAHHQQTLGHVPLLEIERAPFSGWSGVFKWFEDKALASLLFVLMCSATGFGCSGDQAGTALGPCSFAKSGTAFNNQLIEIYKFRTMHHHMRDENAETTDLSKRFTYYPRGWISSSIEHRRTSSVDQRSARQYVLSRDPVPMP